MSWAWCTEGHSHWGTLGAAGLLLAREGTALLQLRAGWAHHGGTWSIPGGAVERGETPGQAALREAHEELGLDAGAVVLRGSWLATCGGWSYETLLGEPRGEVTTRDRAESDAHRWVPAAEVGSLRLHPAFRTAWEHDDRALHDFVLATAAQA